MFDVLVGSGARRQVRASRGVVAAALHAVVISGAIRATVHPVEPAKGPRLDTMVFVLNAPERVVAPGPAAPDGIVPLNNDVRGVAPLAPGDIPVGIPAVDLGTPPLTPGWLRAGPPGPEPSGDGPFALPHTSAEVDVPAIVIHQPEPRYPAVLRAAQREGRVLLEFVIDTLGHVEPASLRVVERTEAGFEAAALETVVRSLFRPARLAGRPVRQRTLQAVAFRISPE